MKNTLLPLKSRLFVAFAAVILFISIFLPLWRIELDAPQYPEGLALEIFPNHIGGDVEIINGLNHYIGMKTLHTEDFIEFTMLPYIILFFAFASGLVAATANRKLLIGLLVLFILFGIISMIDFYRWNYNYGHDLDPNAAIKVPGMAYQPPLIGYKQLLNFGAYSIPAIGGWLIMITGLLYLGALVLSRKITSPDTSSHFFLLIIASSIVGNACSSKEPQSITLHKDVCVYCKMSISEPEFAAQIITNKGKCFKFDDLICLKEYSEEQLSAQSFDSWVAEYSNPSKFIPLSVAYLIFAEDLKSPMRGNWAAFEKFETADSLKQQFNGRVASWHQKH